MAEVWTILNCTPDSFYAPSRVETTEAVVAAARAALDEGATVLDLGGMSTRPGYADVSPEEEYERLTNAQGALPNEARLSIDTFRGSVVERLYAQHGAFVVNDVAGTALDAAATLNLPYVLMSNDPTIEAMLPFFDRQLNRLAQQGHTAEVVLDPGFGFGKSNEQNFSILAQLSALKQFGKRVLVGLSRKRLVWQTAETTPQGALNGTSALHFEALRQGADILRVHDTAPAVHIIKLYEAYRPYSL